MLKVVVFDSGWGGELFADYLERKVPVVEVTRVIDWRNAPYSARGRTEICKLAEEALSEYIGRADVIVLASYAATGAALRYLEWKYPRQRFVGFMAEMGVVPLKEHAKEVMVLATGVVRESWNFQRDQRRMRRLKIVMPECGEWVRMVDDGEMTEAKMRTELGELTEEKVDVVLIYSTGFVDLEPAFSRIYGRRVRVVDEFEKVTQETCKVLGLRGGDGRKG